MGDYNLASYAGYQIPQSGDEFDWGGTAIDLLKEGAGKLGGEEVEMALAGWDIGWGAIDIIDGAMNGDGEQAMGGVHDIAGAGFGLLPGGEAYSLAHEFLAPLVFGENDAWTNRPKVEEMGVDGTYNVGCGNRWLDAIGDTLTGGSESLVGAAGFHKGLNGWNPED